MFNEDISAFFDINEFADVAEKDDGTEVAGILDIEPVETGDFISNEPTFLIPQTSAALLPRDTAVTIKNVAYVVANVVRDDEALIKLVLRNA